MDGTGLTPAQVQALNRPFPLEAHEWKKGRGNRENVYITEYDICNRLDSVDPNWTLVVTDRVERQYITERKNQQGESYFLPGHELAITVALTVCGVTRYGIGMAEIAVDAAEADKSAVTDALKRGARLFGIGRYLLDDPPAKGQPFERWLDGLTHPAAAAHAGRTMLAVEVDRVKTYAGTLELTMDEVKAALKIQANWNEWLQGEDAARSALKAFHDQKEADKKKK